MRYHQHVSVSEGQHAGGKKRIEARIRLLINQHLSIHFVQWESQPLFFYFIEHHDALRTFAALTCLGYATELQNVT